VLENARGEFSEEGRAENEAGSDFAANSRLADPAEEVAESLATVMITMS